jgi:hypothetical protein
VGKKLFWQHLHLTFSFPLSLLATLTGVNRGGVCMPFLCVPASLGALGMPSSSLPSALLESTANANEVKPSPS